MSATDDLRAALLSPDLSIKAEDSVSIDMKTGRSRDVRVLVIRNGRKLVTNLVADDLAETFRALGEIVAGGEQL